MEKNKDRRGGARAGAGRPKGDSQMISFRAPGPLAASLNSMENRTEFIRESLAKAVNDRNMNAEAVSPVLCGDSDLQSIVPAKMVSRRITLPFFDQRVVAGFPVPLDSDERSQDIDVLAMLCPHPEASYLIRVQGNSMIDAGVMSGDIVIVDKSNRNPSPKEIAVCELNGEFTLKHFIKEGEEGWLVPANPDYPRFRITEEDDFSVWGTVTYIIHKARV